MSLALTYEAIRRETSGKPSMREKPAEFWGTRHQYHYGLIPLSVILRVWRHLLGLWGCTLGLYLELVSLF
jgi:hypothetical protein